MPKIYFESGSILKNQSSNFQGFMSVFCFLSSVKIICTKCSSGPVNSNEKLSFSLDCDNCTKSGTSYEWSLYRVADTRPFNPARAHDSR